MLPASLVEALSRVGARTVRHGVDGEKHVHDAYTEYSIDIIEEHLGTVEPPNRRHFGTTAFVLSLEVVPFSEDV